MNYDKTWKPTHWITLEGAGGGFPVLLEEGAAYTRDEWEQFASADYECSDDGQWTFQGEPFAGTVKKIPQNKVSK